MAGQLYDEAAELYSTDIVEFPQDPVDGIGVWGFKGVQGLRRFHVTAPRLGRADVVSDGPRQQLGCKNSVRVSLGCPVMLYVDVVCLSAGLYYADVVSDVFVLQSFLAHDPPFLWSGLK